MAKEILKEEILKEEELDQVAGGTHEETKGDMNYLYNKFRILWPNDWDKAVGQLGSLYYDAGMRLDTSANRPNQYFLRTGPNSEVRIDRYEARRRLSDYLERNRY